MVADGQARVAAVEIVRVKKKGLELGECGNRRRHTAGEAIGRQVEVLHLRRQFVDVSREGAGEVIVGQVEEAESRAAIERRRELVGEIVVGKV